MSQLRRFWTYKTFPEKTPIAKSPKICVESFFVTFSTNSSFEAKELPHFSYISFYWISFLAINSTIFEFDTFSTFKCNDVPYFIQGTRALSTKDVKNLFRITHISLLVYGKKAEDWRGTEKLEKENNDNDNRKWLFVQKDEVTKSKH